MERSLTIYASCLLSASFVFCLLGRRASLIGAFGAARVFEVLSLSALWFASSTSIVLVNRVLLGGGHAVLPLSLSAATFFSKGVIAGAVLSLWRVHAAPDIDALPTCCLRSRARVERLLSRAGVTWHSYVRAIVPIAIATSAVVALSNVALSLAGVPAYTVFKSTSIIWNLIFSLSMRLVAPRIGLFLAVALVGAGAALTAIAPGDVAITGPIARAGAAAAFASAALAALRWTLTERFFASPEGALRASADADEIDDGTPRSDVASVLSLIAVISPLSSLVLLPFAGLEILNAGGLSSDRWAELGVAGVTVGAAALILLSAELALVARTSSLTLNVLAHTKDAAQFPLSAAILGETLSPLGIVGAVVTIIGSIFYALIRPRARNIAGDAGGDGGCSGFFSGCVGTRSGGVDSVDTTGGRARPSTRSGYTALFHRLSAFASPSEVVPRADTVAQTRVDSGGFEWDDDEEGEDVVATEAREDDSLLFSDTEDSFVVNAGGSAGAGGAGARVASPRRSASSAQSAARSLDESDSAVLVGGTTPTRGILSGLFSPSFTPSSQFAPRGIGGDIIRGPPVPKMPKGQGSMHLMVFLGENLGGRSKRPTTK